MEIPLAARTITSVMCQTYPVSAFLYNRKPPLPKVLYGKHELSIYLLQIYIRGLILSIDSEDEKCVGVAVWTGPAKQRPVCGRFISEVSLVLLNKWLLFALVYYRGAGMDARVTNGYEPSGRLIW